MPDFSEKLKFLMKEKGLSQADISKIVGLSDASITGWMKGAKPRRKALEKLCNHFKLSLTSMQDNMRDIEFLDFPDFRLTEKDYREEDELTAYDDVFSRIVDTDWNASDLPNPEETIAENISYGIAESIFTIGDQIKIIESITRKNKVITRDTLFKIISKCNAASSSIFNLTNLLCLCFVHLKITKIKKILTDWEQKRIEDDKSYYGE